MAKTERDPSVAYNEYEKTVSQHGKRWAFGNKILYDMCAGNLEHNKEDVIVGKIWLIGRSYAAAIERGKGKGKENDDFYYDIVAPEIKGIGSELDKRIQELRMSNRSIGDEYDLILSTHKLLMEAFSNMVDGLHKRSLASKYLHFHCPDKFYIYDSRAESAVRMFIHKKLDFSIEIDEKRYDSIYSDFFCRMIELEKYIGKGLNPRDLDSFLLWAKLYEKSV